ncbi:hypothetical protein D3873_02150 [Paenisporosarcina cavernae]|uniref:Uncharacterized protein n=1 Tax=Paenisporosarcina cavernae TaxID=2320858 RepID=A0A385YV23_9BACL|nr:hypothetical protein D3873_02150 [Paenisporosarcina cavernae]
MINRSTFAQKINASKDSSAIKFAKIEPDYTAGRPRLIFDGELIPTIKKYPFLSSYAPKANDRVMIISGVIQGKIV